MNLIFTLHAILLIHVMHGADYRPPNIKLSPQAQSLVVLVDSDPELRKQQGAHLQYRVYYNEKNGNMKEHGDSRSPVTIKALEVGVEYCVKVEYVCYQQPLKTVNSSNVECAIIPESEKTRVIRIVLVLLAMALMGVLILCCLCWVSRNHSKVKNFLQPPLKLPAHVHEFLAKEDFDQLPQSSSRSETFENISMVTFKVVEEIQH